MPLLLKKGLIIFSICLNLAFIGVTLYVGIMDPGRWRERLFHGRHELRILRSLELSPELENRVESLMDTHRLEMKGLRQKHRASLLAVMTALVSPVESNPGGLVSARARFIEVNRERGDTIIRNLVALRELLPPDKAEALFDQLIDLVRRPHGKRD